MLQLARRNDMLYFRDKSVVMLSFLAEGIMLGLYLLFLRRQLLAAFAGMANAALLADAWMLAGLISVTAVTTAMGVYGVAVEDRAKNAGRDLYISPVGRTALPLGYWLAAAAVGLLLSFLLLLFSEAYIAIRYGVRLGAGTMEKVYAVLILVSASGAARVLLIVSFLKSSGALAGCCTIVGAMLGFLAGIYLPIGSMPEGVRRLVQCFPVSHGAVLLRQLLLEALLPPGAGASLSQYLGCRYVWDGAAVSPAASALFLTLGGVVCLLLAAARFARPPR